MAEEIVKKILHPPELPHVVKGDGRYLMTLLRQFLAEQAMQINAANSFTADEVKQDIEGVIAPVRNFRLRFDRLGGVLEWDSVRNVKNLKCYEIRTNKNVGSDVGLLERTVFTKSDRLPVTYVGRVYLYVIDKDGQASTPLELSYNKMRPTAPTDIALTKNNEGTLITFLEIPLDCIGAHIYIDGKRYDSLDNVFLYTGEGKIKTLEISYYDQFGEGGRASLSLDVPSVQGFIVERVGANLYYQWDALPIHNVSYEVRVGITATWETSLKLFETKLNKHRYVYPNTGACYMLIKAIDEHGNYSNDAVYYHLVNEKDIHKNVIVSLKQETLGYQGVKYNLYYDAVDEALLLENGAMEGSYLIYVDLPKTYRARNWLDYKVIGSFVSDAVFDDLTYTWDSDEAEGEMWNGVASDLSGVEVKTEIARQDDDIVAEYLEIVPFSNTLDTIRGGKPSSLDGSFSYKTSKWHDGLVLSGYKTLRYSVNIPALFGAAFWLKLPRQLLTTAFLTLEGADGSLAFRYEKRRGAYSLAGSDGCVLSCKALFHAGDHILLGVSQTQTKRTLYVFSTMSKKTEIAEKNAEPIGTFQTVKLDTEGGVYHA